MKALSTLNRLLGKPEVLQWLVPLLTLIVLSIIIPAVVGACLEPLVKGEPICSRGAADEWLVIALLFTTFWLYIGWLTIRVVSRPVVVDKAVYEEKDPKTWRYYIALVGPINVPHFLQKKFSELEIEPPKTVLELETVIKTHPNCIQHTTLWPVLNTLKAHAKALEQVWLIHSGGSAKEVHFISSYADKVLGCSASFEPLDVLDAHDPAVVRRIQNEIERIADVLPDGERSHLVVNITGGTLLMSLGCTIACTNRDLLMQYNADLDKVLLGFKSKGMSEVHI